MPVIFTSSVNHCLPMHGTFVRDDWSDEELTVNEDLEWLCKMGVRFDSSNQVHLGVSYRILSDRLRQWARKATSDDISEAEKSLQSVLTDKDSIAPFLAVPHKSTKPLLQILLEIKELQMPVVRIACQIIGMLAFEQPNEKLKSLCHKIVASFSFLPEIVEPEEFVDQLFEAIGSTHDQLKPIIVESLNHIFDSSCTQSIVKNLITMMIETPALTQDALAALEGFDLPDDGKQEVRARVMSDILSGSSTRDLPTVMRFLVNTTDDTNAESTVNAFRESLVIAQPNVRVESLTVDETNMFMMIQIKSALQFNQCFCQGYIKALDKVEELNTLDIWVLIALFAISSKRGKSEELMKNLVGDKLNPSNARDSVIGHGKAFDCVLSVIPELIFWCLDSTDDKMIVVGASWASAFFEELANISALQDIAASLCTQIGIGSDSSKMNAAAVLARLADEQPKKLSLFSPLIQGLLASWESLPLNIFRDVINTMVRVTLLEVGDIEREATINVFMTKMMGSTKHEAQCAGVITAGAFMNRMAEFVRQELLEFSVLERQFENVVGTIGDNAITLNTFLHELLKNPDRGSEFNEFLIQRLTRELGQLVFPSKDKNIEWYGLAESDECIDFSNVVSVPEARHTLSVQQQRILSSARNAGFVFTQYGLQLLLDAIMQSESDFMENFGRFFTLPIAMFNREGPIDEVPRSHRIQMVLMAHSWIMENINYFATIAPEQCWTRLEHRVDLESCLLSYLNEDKTYTHPFLGNMFPKYPGPIKRALTLPDPRLDFISRYRSALSMPKMPLISMIKTVTLPVETDIQKRCILSILDDYLYMLQPAVNAIMYIDKVKEPPIDIISFIAKELLPAFIESESELDHLVTGKIFNVLNAQLQLPIYRDKHKHSEIMNAISGKKKKEACFAKFQEMVLPALPQMIKLNVIELLRRILHSGTGRYDALGDEAKALREMCKEMLTTSTPVLGKDGVKQILPIFFEHHSEVLDEIDTLATEVITPEIFGGGGNPDWPSLKSATFGLYFKQCFSTLTKLLGEVQKRTKNNKKGSVEGFIDDDTIDLCMQRLNKIARASQTLLEKISSSSVPSTVHKIVIVCSSPWLDTCTSLLPFLKIAKDANPEPVDEFITTSRTIRTNVQSVVDHVRRNASDLQNFLPKLTKSLSNWTYSLRNSGLFEDSMRLGTMNERTIDGDIVESE